MSTDKPLWEAPYERKKNTTVVKFINKIVNKYGPLPPNIDGEVSNTLNRQLFEQLHQWTIMHLPEFWSELWDFFNIIGNKGSRLVDYGKSMIDTNYLPDAKLSFSENMMKNCNIIPNEIAITSWIEDKYKEDVTYSQLYNRVSVLSQAFASAGLKEGDRVAGIVANVPNALISMLAVNSLGGVWSSSSPDFGVHGLLERFGQIKPKFIVCSDFYIYKDIKYPIIEKINQLKSKIPSVQQVIVLPYTLSDSIPVESPNISLKKFTEPFKPAPINFLKTSFNAPAFILYSSGTTGLPKCFIHRTGIILQLMKEHQLHIDMKPGNRLFHATTCGWMMWNWSTTCLASGINLALYDGSTFHPDPAILWKYASEKKLNYVGISPKYLEYLKKIELYDVYKKYDLSSLKVIGTAGSPLTKFSFQYVYTYIKSDVHLSTFSGGTDLISCFVAGNPLGPVWGGEIQTKGLGMDVHIYNDEGQPVKAENGELVCISPWITQPIAFFNDPTKEKYKEAYFTKFPGIWAHGDLTEYTIHNGIIIHGRSDAVLNPGGVRIGTSEIYRIVDQLDEIAECAAVSRDITEEDIEVYLFVIMNPGFVFSNETVKKVKDFIRVNATTRHVPKEVIEVKSIPVTKTGKIAELAIRDVLHHRKVKNITSIDNPESLKQFLKYAVPLKSKM